MSGMVLKTLPHHKRFLRVLLQRLYTYSVSAFNHKNGFTIVRNVKPTSYALSSFALSLLSPATLRLPHPPLALLHG